MRSFDSKKMMLAAVIAVVGVGLAGLALYRSIRPQPESGASMPFVPPEVEQRLSGIVFDSRPTMDSLAQLVSAAADRVREESRTRGLVQSERVDDLVKAFTERLRATLGGDFEEDRIALRNRGDVTPAADAESRRAAWQVQAAETRLAPFSTAQIDVVAASENGTEVVDPAMSSFGILTWSASSERFPENADLQKTGVDLAEVRVPMEKKAMRGGGRRPVIVGYQFAWNPRRQQWIPWRVKVYCRPGEVHTAVIF